MSINTALKPLDGVWQSDTKIVIGLDIGVTESNVSFAFLEKGEKKVVRHVTRWPGGQDNCQSKVPTLIWYDTDRKAVSFGADALLPTTEEQAEDNSWLLARDFKLHLQPPELSANPCIMPHLPNGVSLRQIYSDFLGYLLKHTRAYFEDHIINGKNIWERHSPTMEVVIAHPNGWGVREQAFLRTAAVDAGFSTSNQAASKVRFVTEAEASVHFCIHHTNLGTVLRPGTNFVVCDAGASMVNTTLYSVISAEPALKLKEERVLACAQVGHKCVDAKFEQFLHKTLAYADLDTEDLLEYEKEGTRDFEARIKWAFDNISTNYSIAIAPPRFANPSIAVRRGRMTLSGSTIMSFFDPCIHEITAGVDHWLDKLNVPHILLTGEFGNSPYLQQALQEHYGPRGIQIYYHVNNYSGIKANAYGATIWGITNQFKRQYPRFSWGIETSIAHDCSNPDHLNRQIKVSALGRVVIQGRWHNLHWKEVAVDQDAISRVPISLDFPSLSSELGKFKLDLFNYLGNDKPLWMRDKQGKLLPSFWRVACIYVNLKDIHGGLRSRITLDGLLQCQLNFDICMKFGGTELVAYSEWEEEGIVRKGSCTLTLIVSDDA